MSGIENGRKLGQTLGHDRGEEHVPCRQEEWEFCFLASARAHTVHSDYPSSQKTKKKKKKRKKDNIPNFAVCSTHLLKRITPPERQIQSLQKPPNQQIKKTKKKTPSIFPAKTPLKNETVVTIRNIKRRMQIRLGSRRAWHSSSSTTSRRGRAIHSRLAAFEFPILVATAASGHADVVFGRHDPVRMCV